MERGVLWVQKVPKLKQTAENNQSSRVCLKHIHTLCLQHSALWTVSDLTDHPLNIKMKMVNFSALFMWNPTTRIEKHSFVHWGSCLSCLHQATNKRKMFAFKIMVLMWNPFRVQYNSIKEYKTKHTHNIKCYDTLLEKTLQHLHLNISPLKLLYFNNIINLPKI